MTNQSTMDKLIEMRLTAMADAFRSQLDDPKFKEIPFEDQFGMLVDIEYSSRKNNRLKRLIKNAGFDQPEANIMDINYTSGRKLNKELIRRLATCEYISEHRNLFITGATGCGKTYMACAFGMEACKQYYNTKYVRLPDLLIDLEMARTDGNYKKVMAKYANPLSPFTEAVTVPFQIFLVVCRHMFCKGAVLPGASFQTTMGSNAVMVVKNFNRGICYPYINFLFDVFIRNGV